MFDAFFETDIHVRVLAVNTEFGNDHINRLQIWFVFIYLLRPNGY